MILNLRGGNGSGKSYVHHWLLDNHEHRPLYLANFNSIHQQKPRVWQLDGIGRQPLFVIGRYQPGADGIAFKPLGDLVKAFAPHGHVFFENVMVAANISSWLPVRRALADHEWIWATLDTPLELCFERIYARNGGAPLKEPAIVAHYKRTHKCHNQLVEAGERTVMIDHERSVQQVEELLHEGGWDCCVAHR